MPTPPRWFTDLPERDQERVLALLRELAETAAEMQQLSDLVGVELTIWDEPDPAAAMRSLLARAEHARELVSLQARLAVCYDRLARAIAGPAWPDTP